MVATKQERPLGRTQMLVLRLLAGGAKSAQTLGHDWPGLTASSARSAVMRLGMRGLVDMAGWNDYNQRTYRLTEKGAEVERSLNRDKDEEGDLDA